MSKKLLACALLTSVSLVIQRWRSSIAKKAELYPSVQNLFNKSAPLYSAPNQSLPGWGGFPHLYRDDTIRRYFTFGVRAQFWGAAEHNRTL